MKSEHNSMSTMVVSGSASRAEHERATTELNERNAVVDHCRKCEALLDVSGCSPLTETSCPCCGALIKVLRDFHHFVLLSQLGQGGAGTVYRAFDETLERDVALKLLRNEHTQDPAFRAALEREAEITGSINHSQVVKVFSTGWKNGFFYIAMEILNGGTLAEELNRHGNLPESTVLSYGIQIAEGLQAAWRRGLVHRDVKPGNILFAGHEAIKVGDFGLALAIERPTDDSEDIWGTPSYMAPEKLLRKGEDLRSDIYSFGCTLFHCLAGRPPFDTSQVMAFIRDQAVPKAPNIQAVAPNVSGAVAFIIKRCLESSPADRYQDYEELIEHLHYVRDKKALPTKATASNKGSRPPSSGSARNLRARIAFFSTLAALIIVAFAFISSRQAREGTSAIAAAAAPSTPRATEPARPFSAIYEAEDAVLTRSAMVNSKHHNYSGSGYVEGLWTQGSSVAFRISAPKAGPYNVRIHYANGDTIAKSISFYVNGEKKSKLTFNALGSPLILPSEVWSTWSDLTEAVTLQAGPNSIQFQFDPTDTGRVNFDYIELTEAPGRP